MNNAGARAVQTAVGRALSALPPDARVLCALSGGADSVAMTHCMMLACRKAGRPVAAAHYNHHLRGAESDRDEAFVRTLCAQWSLPLTVGGGVVTALGTGTEDAARRLRYAFLRQTAAGAWIATAHTMDDQAETVLLQLIRGTGLHGLGAMAPEGDGLFRPLLGVRRGEVEAYLKAYALPYVEDSTNGQDGYRRNRVRHRLLPWMAAENPRIVPALSELARQARQAEDFLSELTAAALETARDGDGCLRCQALRTQHPALRARVLRAAAPVGLTSRQTAALDALVRGDDPSAAVSLPGGWVARRDYDRLRFEGQRPPAWTPVRLPVPGKCEIPALGWTVCCENCVAPPETSQIGYTFYVARDTITGDIWLRPRQTGDTVRLPGGSRSLKRLMIDRKIPAAARDRMPVLADDAGVLAVPGVAAHLSHLAPPGRPALRISVTIRHG